MSFMFTPYPYDDLTAVNRPELGEGLIGTIITGTKETAGHLSGLLIDKLEERKDGSVIFAMDGYIGARWDQVVNLISQEMKMGGVDIRVLDFAEVYKSAEQLDAELSGYLQEDMEKDPVKLFGKIYKEGFEGLLDDGKLESFKGELKKSKGNTTVKKEVIIIYGCGCAISALRPLYDLVCYFDVTPKETILRARNGCFANLGDKVAKPIKALLRRCYYVDFEVAVHLRGELVREGAIDYYVASSDPGKLQVMPLGTFKAMMSSLVNYPLRCKPVYLEGVWGGHYIHKLRHLPAEMRNCAWVFDLIPMEVSLLIEAGDSLVEFPFFTFVQAEGEALMGGPCVEKFGGYFPIRFNFDDSYHSSGNMSVQVHSGHHYNIDNYGEYGRQDESYYVIATGHGAKTYIGFNKDADFDEFIKEAKKSEKEFTPIDYQKYVNHVDSRPGIQFMIPAGTIHSSGRNQVVLEIGSLTIGSYTYKMYDYLRKDFDGKPRPIHTYHGERVLKKERTTDWVRENLVQDPRVVRKGEGWAEYIVGEHDLLYFSLRRFEFEKTIEDDTNGKFHVLNLVDGEKVRVESIDNPDRSYTLEYLNIIIVPANIGRYRVVNLGNQPVCVHKTMLKDGFDKESIPGD